MSTRQTVTIPFIDPFTGLRNPQPLTWGLRSNVRSKTPAISLQGYDDHSATESLSAVNHDTGHVEEIASSIMRILEGFSLQQQGNDVFLGTHIFSPLVRRHVTAGSKIPMVLPAFPAKSINVVEKVLGPSPDLGEELALDRLNDLCSRIQKVYAPGAMVLIATDGACYNDLTGVTNDNLWEYGVALRRMVADKGYRCIDFERFISLLEPSRRELMDRYVDPNFDATACIKNDPDYKMTYDGYAKFLKKDLAFGAVRNSMTSGKKFKAKVHETAKAMIARGVAFAELIREKCPDHVRLSIHPSTGLTKISMPLIPQPNSFSMTPWHCAVAVNVKGHFKTAHVAALRDSHELIYKNEQAYFFRERSDLWEFDAKVEFEHFYGGGLVVRKASGEEPSRESLSDSDKEKLASIAISCGKVVVKGFE
ncbi:Pyoverdine dityrosine biosynthesis [Fusarium albosuccineum]|uniref:Pyoverdine dityrosine biosynthesis n=1 Tax=Fusarium albosuccineum TaxID=1237068 RepID=A0A8H4KSL2_9HYPO|nr:Pyoverdine dityrosine biosynthesis [Fusarium albosuccineum]